MQHEQPKVAGEGSGEFVTAVLGFLFSLLRMIFYIVFPVAAVGIDLYLSGAFMDGYSAQYGAHGVITEALPIIFTIATTGLQNAINARTQAGFRSASFFGKCTIVVGWGLIALDTATDVGGFTALYTGDVATGANILPPGWQNDPYFILGALLVILFCGGQERIVPLIYGRWGKNIKILQGSDDTAGAFMVRAGEAAGGFIYTWITNILRPIGLLSVLLLDVVLMPNFIGQKMPMWAAWGVSLFFTAFGWFLWDQAEKVAFRRLDDGTLGLKVLTTGTKITLAVSWAIMVADVFLDVAGYTRLVYGDRADSFLLPPIFSWSWLITAVIMGVNCFAGDVLVKEVLRRPKKDGDASPSPSPSDPSTPDPKGFYFDDDDDEDFRV